jgi:outer membrane lipoprotein-sorting protein
MRKLLPLLAVVLTPSLNASPLTQSDVDQLIQKLQALHESKPSFSANFREERHNPMLKDPVVNEGKVWFTLPDKIRREIDGKTPSTTVIDGKKMSIYYPNFKEVEVYDMEKRPMLKDSISAITAGLDFRRVTNFYTIEGSKDDSEYHLRLTPKTASVKKLVQSVDVTIDENLTPSHVDVVDVKGGKISEVYTNVRRDNIPPATFDFSPPPGTKVSTPLGS